MRRASPGPLLLTVVLFIALCTTLLVAATAACDGRLTYALDDPYVQLATARNLAEHGVWGLSRHAFTSSAPSPLWTAALAVVSLLTGSRPGWPLVLNLLAGLWLIAVVEQAVRLLAPRTGRGGTLAVLCGVVIFAPLAPLVFTGQEHLLLAALALSFTLAAARAAEEPDDVAETRPEVLLAGLGMPMVATGAEGIFVVLSAVLYLFARGRGRLGVVTLLAALAPLLGYALVAMSLGWPPLPTPYLVYQSSTVVEAIMLGIRALEQLLAAPHLLVLLVAALALAGWRSDDAPDTPRAVLLLFIGATLLHAQFGRLGWMDRHAAHLVVIGLVAVGARLAALSVADFGISSHVELSGAAARAYRARRMRRMLLVLLMLVPLLQRGLRAAYEVPRATTHVYEQQVQVGLFLAQFYRGANVAVSEPGAASWFGDASLFDISGVGTAEVAIQRLRGTWTSDVLEPMAREHGVRIAILLEQPIEVSGGVPPDWERVGTWRIPVSTVHGRDVIGFYAAQPMERAELERALEDFRIKLPRSVIVSLDPPARRM